MRNCPSWIVCLHGVLKAGAIATLINGWWQSDEMSHALSLTEPKLIIADAARAKRLDATGLPADLVSLPVERPLTEALAPLLDTRRRRRAAGGGAGGRRHDPVHLRLDRAGQGRGVDPPRRHDRRLPIRSACSTLLGIKESKGESPVNPPRTLVNVPLFHVTGEVPVLLNSFVIGRCMVLMPKWDAGEALRLIEEEKITYFVGVPTMSLELMQHPDRDKYDLSTLTDIAAGGAPRPVAHVPAAGEFRGAQPALGYGLTETNAVGCGNFWSNYADKPASTGRPHKPIVELAILGEAGAPAGPASAARSPSGPRPTSAAIGAIPRRQPPPPSPPTAICAPATSAISTRTIICSSSIARRTSSSAAARISAPGSRSGDLRTSARFGGVRVRSRRRTARRGSGRVVYSEQGGLAKEELLAFLSERIAQYKVPAWLWLVGEPLPKLGTGKIDKVSLREIYGNEVRATT
jgi:long-chain acyl-CoA synthetase